MRTISDYRFSKLRKLKLWYGHVTRSDGLTKVILQGKIEGSRRTGGLTTSRIGPANSSHCGSHGTQPAGLERADEEIRHNAPLELLAELRDQGKARQGNVRQISQTLRVTPTFHYVMIFLAPFDIIPKHMS